MRYADIEFDYGVDEIVTRTTIVEPPKPAQTAPAVQTSQPKQPDEVVVEEEMGIIVATPNHSDDNSENRRNQRKARKADKKNIKGGYEAIYW